MVPRKNPCQPITFDKENLADPFHKNPPLKAPFYDLTSWKNGRNGAIALNVGWVEFWDFKTADNILAGIEFEHTDNFGDGKVRVEDAVVVGKTTNTFDPSTGLMINFASPKGIIAPKTEFFTIKNIKFINYDFNKATALGDCSHCFHNAATDSGARTYTTSELEF